MTKDSSSKNNDNHVWAEGYDAGYINGYRCGLDGGWANGFDDGVKWEAGEKMGVIES